VRGAFAALLACAAQLWPAARRRFGARDFPLVSSVDALVAQVAQERQGAR
jgi:hypothetical protein